MSASASFLTTSLDRRAIGSVRSERNISAFSWFYPSELSKWNDDRVGV